MTTFDSTPTARTSTDAGRPSGSSDRRPALVDRLRDDVPFALLLGGQGAPWLEPLAELARDFALETELRALVERADDLLAPVAVELSRTGTTMDPLGWLDVLAVGESAEDLDATVAEGLGLRWSFIGPLQVGELNAPAGLADYLTRYGPFFARVAAGFDGEAALNPDNIDRCIEAWGAAPSAEAVAAAAVMRPF